MRRSRRLQVDSSPVNESNVCAICLESPQQLAWLDGCSHCFCFECINSWAEVTNLCPLCKAPFYQIQARHRMREVDDREQRVPYDTDTPDYSVDSDDSEEEEEEEALGSDSDFDPEQAIVEEELPSLDGLSLSEDESDWDDSEETPEPSSEMELDSDSL